jgi:hypothetical protein
MGARGPEFKSRRSDQPFRVLSGWTGGLMPGKGVRAAIVFAQDLDSRVTRQAIGASSSK